MYDAVIIGGGPGGYACAIRIAQLGGKVVLVEKDSIGGCCVNHGCIPTKALYESAKISKYKKAADSLDYGEIFKKKGRVVRASMLGVESLLDSFGVKVFRGAGRIADKNSVEVGPEKLETRNIVIATGSSPITVPGIEIDHKTVIDSTDALGMQPLPKDMIVCGGGVIGLEFASIFSRFGVKTTVIEMLPRIAPSQDVEVSEHLEKEMKRAGITVLAGAKIAKVSGNTVEVTTADGKSSSVSAEKILMAIGRRPFFDKEEMDRIGVKYGRGIAVDSHMRTNVKGIYAIGDVTDTVMLAHVASAQGEVAAGNIMRHDAEMSYDAIPSAIFTFPEIGSVGTTSQSQEARDAKVGRFPFAASGKARAAGEVSGFVKVMAKDGRLVGVHIIGPGATEMIAEAALAVRNRLSITQIANTIHAHPTLAESFLEAVRDIDNRSVNLPKK